MRPGEKLFEELDMNEEEMSRTLHPKIFIGKIAAYPPQQVREALEKLSYLARNGDEWEIRSYLNKFLPEARLEVKGLEAVSMRASTVWAPAVEPFDLLPPLSQTE